MAFKHLVMEVASDWMLRLSRNEEVCGNHPSSCGENTPGQLRPWRRRGAGGGGVTLVDELVEGVLAVGPGLAPHDGPRVVAHAGAIFGDVLPVRFHVALATTDTARLLGLGLTQPAQAGRVGGTLTCWK